MSRAEKRVNHGDRIAAFEDALWNAILRPLGASEATRRRLRDVVAMDMEGMYRTGQQDEREACAKIADAYDDTHNDGDEGRYGKGAADEIAAAIRARSNDSN